MTSPVSGSGSGTQVPGSNASWSIAGAGGKLGKEEFLQMLVTQMRYQDPMNPMEGQEFAAQLAQFSSVEQLVTANDTLAKIRELLSTATAPAPAAEGDDATTKGAGTSTGTGGTPAPPAGA